MERLVFVFLVGVIVGVVGLEILTLLIVDGHNKNHNKKHNKNEDITKT